MLYELVYMEPNTFGGSFSRGRLVDIARLLINKHIHRSPHISKDIFTTGLDACPYKFDITLTDIWGNLIEGRMPALNSINMETVIQFSYKAINLGKDGHLVEEARVSKGLSRLGLSYTIMLSNAIANKKGGSVPPDASLLLAV